MSSGRQTLDAAVQRAPRGLDTAGWGIRDHLAHVIAWERALIAVLRGGSTPEALGYSREEYEAMDTDVLNQQLVERARGEPLASVVRQMGEVRHELLDVLEALSDSQVETRFEDVRRWEAPNEPTWTAWDWLMAYAPAHDEEHARYIQALEEN